MASRSVLVNFQNQTSQTLSRTSFGLQGGIWSNGPNGQMVPPEQIPPHTNVTWESESNGLMTGTQGYANYDVAGNSSQTVALTWDDPYAGSDGYTGVCSPPYSLTTIGGQGDNATVVYTLSGS
ncbi:MAG: Crystal protein ET79 [Acidobacteria bacterium]|nr:Crystal protein ET79 [Acidobacteriota bacterium]